MIRIDGDEAKGKIAVKSQWNNVFSVRCSMLGAVGDLIFLIKQLRFVFFFQMNSCSSFCITFSLLPPSILNIPDHCWDFFFDFHSFDI